MFKHPSLTQERIAGALPAIQALIYPAKHPVQIEAWHVGGEAVLPEKALKADYAPFDVGDLWGPAWDTTWFRVRGEVPAAWTECMHQKVSALSMSERGLHWNP